MNISDLIDPKNRARKYLNREERKFFFEATTYMEVDIKFYARIIYYTGCRTGEALEVSPEMLDYEEKGVVLRTLKQNPKKPPRFRFVELPESFLIALHDVYKIRGKQGKKIGRDPIWSFTRRTASNYIKKVMDKAGISGLKATARGLRHSIGVTLAQEKVPLHVIQQILGHASIKNTEIYTHIVGKERREMISRVW
ncbi:MAG: site-specific integrase [Saprospiraceae bacterium]